MDAMKAIVIPVIPFMEAILILLLGEMGPLLPTKWRSRGPLGAPLGLLGPKNGIFNPEKSFPGDVSPGKEFSLIYVAQKRYLLEIFRPEMCFPQKKKMFHIKRKRLCSRKISISLGKVILWTGSRQRCPQIHPGPQ